MYPTAANVSGALLSTTALSLTASLFALGVLVRTVLPHNTPSAAIKCLVSTLFLSIHLFCIRILNIPNYLTQQFSNRFAIRRSRELKLY